MLPSFYFISSHYCFTGEGGVEDAVAGRFDVRASEGSEDQVQAR